MHEVRDGVLVTVQFRNVLNTQTVTSRALELIGYVKAECG